ncbi:NapC/NirT family cytochrome c [Neobacillus sp. MM2021_6]|uniref:cytochrome c3 family protein n=1 Tax=Bacillaceae TaxID=186817 RepID=UPI001407E339|nr:MULTISPECIES: cytochrome c3 family protein [Bacillaceae]MBO0961419.1 NapC/NirT family cytochrome c [Neobacillus sp. MM2021_6]NHC19523.1 cytochrome C [Bacillus sp. MM2020_4]
MVEEEKTRLDPPRYRYKLIKIMTLALFFLVIFLALGFSGLKATSSSGFCSSCHEMKPEVYTWKASTHSEVDCTSCHTNPVLKELAKDKSKEAVENLIKQTSSTSAAPIRMIGEVPDSACKSCHDVSKRDVTPSGDLIIPHDKHMDKDIECSQCHSGVAHGKIADRKMTYQTDLDKWDEEIGKEAMADLKFTRPDMDTCMECHKARKVSTECKTCHTTGMVPKNHKVDNFKTKSHGLLAGEGIKECNECHKYMSSVDLEGYEEGSALNKYLNQSSKQQAKDQYDYAKENTFCVDCHSKRPASHENSFISKHGDLAKVNQQMCTACHSINGMSTPSTNQVNCSSCHQSSHSKKNPNWKDIHKIPIAPDQKPSELCYTCHVKDRCTSCHKDN